MLENDADSLDSTCFHAATSPTYPVCLNFTYNSSETHNFVAATANSVSSDMSASSLVCYSGLRYI
jgi:hypothetical protein